MAILHQMLLYSYGASGGPPPALDTLTPTPQAALSIIKLISTATTPIRVRRSSDNAEMDVGFSGSALDTATMLAWSGSDSVFVTKVYDQTGHGFDAVQATATKQARIVNAGVYDGKLVFDGTDDFYKITSLTQGTPQVGIYGKYSIPNNASLSIIAEQSTNYNSNAQSFVLYTDFGASQPMSLSMQNGLGAFRQQIYSCTTGSMKQFTPEQAEFIGGAEKGHLPMIYGDEIIVAPSDRIAESLASAFKLAINAAIAELGLSADADFNIACDPPAPGQIFLRVTVTTDTGVSASAIGMIPDPRRN